VWGLLEDHVVGGVVDEAHVAGVGVAVVEFVVDVLDARGPAHAFDVGVVVVAVGLEGDADACGEAGAAELVGPVSAEGSLVVPIAGVDPFFETRGELAWRGWSAGPGAGFEAIHLSGVGVLAEVLGEGGAFGGADGPLEADHGEGDEQAEDDEDGEDLDEGVGGAKAGFGRGACAAVVRTGERGA